MGGTSVSSREPGSEAERMASSSYKVQPRVTEDAPSWERTTLLPPEAPAASEATELPSMEVDPRQTWRSNVEVAMEPEWLNGLWKN